MVRKAKTQIEKIEQKQTFSSLTDSFLSNRQLIGLSPKTLTFYRDILNYLNNHGFPLDIENCTTEDAEEYISTLLNREKNIFLLC